MSDIWEAYVDGAPQIALRPLTLVANRRNTAPSYFAVTLGFETALLDLLLARSADLVQITRNGAPWSYFNQQAPLVSVGGRSGTITLRGYRQQTFSAPRSLSLANESVVGRRHQADGTVSLSIDPALDFLPQDLVAWAGGSWRVNKVDALLSTTRNITINLTEIVP